MKKLFFLFILISNYVLAQQVTLLQPALRDSNMQLDSLYYFSTVLPSGIETLYFKEYFLNYDIEKNPTVINLEFLDGNNNITGSLRANGEFHSINEYYTEHDLGPNWLPLKYSESEILNPTTNEWLPYYTTQEFKDSRYSFINEGSTIEETEYIYDENFFIDFIYKNEATMQGDLPIERRIFNWNSTINESVLESKKIFYNTFTNSLLTERRTNVITNFNTNEEIISQKEIFNINDTLFEYFLYNWNGAFSTWENNRKIITTYNAINKPIELNKFRWFSNTSSWNLSEEIEYFYDENDLLINLIITYYFGNIQIQNYNFIYDIDFLLTEYTIENIQGGNSTELERYQFFYSPDNTNAITDLETKINIYPNPATTILNIESQEELDFKIYSIQGKLIKQGVAYQKINITNLEKGIYFINFKTDIINSTQKIIIE